MPVCVIILSAGLPLGKKNGAKGSELAPAPLPSRQATFLFLARSEQLDAEEQETVCQLRRIHPYELVQAFAQMVRTRTGKMLDTWLAQDEASQIPELRSFVQGVERDKEAVKAGLTWQQSNGIVEGKVNKLKLDFAHGIRSSWFCPPAPTCPPCSLISCEGAPEP